MRYLLLPLFLFLVSCDGTGPGQRSSTGSFWIDVYEDKYAKCYIYTSYGISCIPKDTKGVINDH